VAALMATILRFITYSFRPRKFQVLTFLTKGTISSEYYRPRVKWKPSAIRSRC